MEKLDNIVSIEDPVSVCPDTGTDLPMESAPFVIPIGDYLMGDKFLAKPGCQLPELNNHKYLLMENINDLFLLLDSRMNIVYCSNGILKLLELKDFNIIEGRHVSCLKRIYRDHDLIDRCSACFIRIISGEDSIITDAVINWPKESRRTYRMNYKRVQDGYGKFDGIVLVMQDVTDLKRLETENHLLALQNKASQTASEAKSQFLANMSHEIRTPMNAVLGMAELLLSTELSSSQLRYAEDIKISTVALLDVINEILDHSKIQSGSLTLSPVHYNFRALINHIESIGFFLANKKKLDFKLTLHGEPPRCLYGDDVRLKQVLLNLISNAVKFTEKGRVELIVSITKRNIKFSVKDTGIGIKAENFNGLFSAFNQADMQKNRIKEGAGLGLPIAKSLIEMMGGHIEVKSEHTKGSVFHCIIPKIPGDESLIKKTSESYFVVYAPLAKILVVDDNAINLNVACGLLQLCKIGTDTASSGPEAIELLRKNQYDMVFMDHMMPGMDGIEATRIIRGMGMDVPIIALTANAMAGVKEEFLNAGMNDMLAKPIERALLNRILAAWIPPEKLEEKRSGMPDTAAAPDSDEAAGQEDFWSIVENIDGLSTRTGLGLIFGQRDVYEDLLRLSIAEIEKCDNSLTSFLASGNMPGFAIEAHSMKSSLANIGAIELSAAARALESAANLKNVSYCGQELPSFLKGINDLNSSLKKAFAAKKSSRGPVEIPPGLPAIFESMLAAFDEMDFLAINDALKNLSELHSDGALKEEIEKIVDAVMVMDYDGARQVMHELSAHEH